MINKNSHDLSKQEKIKHGIGEIVCELVNGRVECR